LKFILSTHTRILPSYQSSEIISLQCTKQLLILVHKACFSNVIFDLFKQNELKDKVTLDENKVDTETLPGKLSK
jgi:hypothetical protein